MAGAGSGFETFCRGLLQAPRAAAGAGQGNAPGPGPAPAYSQGLELALQMLVQSMAPTSKLALARRMLEVFRHLEQVALAELGGSEPEE